MARGAGETRKITLTRRTVSEIKLTGMQGRAKTVSVEVRKKRTYVKRSAVMEEEAKRRAEEDAVLQVELEQQRAEEERRSADRAQKEAAEEQERRRKQEEDARRKQEEDAHARAEAERRRAEAEARRLTEEEDRRMRAALPRGKAVPGVAASIDDKHTRYGRAELHVGHELSSKRKKNRPRQEELSTFRSKPSMVSRNRWHHKCAKCPSPRPLPWVSWPSAWR